MIFRTGSVLIVGNCNENILNIIYNYLKNVINNEYDEIFIKINNEEKKNLIKKLEKNYIIFELNNQLVNFNGC